jgi:hypothetical protein
MMVVLSLSMVTFLALAEVVELDFSSSMPRSSMIGGAAGEDGDVLEHGLAAVAEARGLDRGDLEGAAQLVDDEGGEGLALDVLGDDQQGLPALAIFSSSGSRSLIVGDLLLVDQDVGSSISTSISSGR